MQYPLSSHMHVVPGSLPPNRRLWTVLNSNNKRRSREHTKTGPSSRGLLGWFLFLFHGNHAAPTVRGGPAAWACACCHGAGAAWCVAAGMSCGAGRKREVHMPRLCDCGNSNWQARGIGQRHWDVHARPLSGWRCSPLAPCSWRPIAHMRRRLPIRVDVYDDCR